MKSSLPLTLTQAFLENVAQTPEHTAIHVIEPTKQEFTLSYQTLFQLAAQVAHGFAEQGISRGDRLLISLATSRHFFAVYIAALLTGVIPVVTAVPKPNRSTAVYSQQLQHLADTIEARAIIVADADALPDLHLTQPIVDVTSLMTGKTHLSGGAPVDAEDMAHLQATSGSTGQPKLAIVRHRNIVANVQAIAAAIARRPEDVLVSWLPLYHDMGLIGLAYALYWGCPLIASDPLNFVHNPFSWLHLINRFGGTLSPAPNSAFQVCARLAQIRPPSHLDLSTWRVALCGSEQVYARTIAQFQAVFGQYGFRESTMLPVYGLAEATLAVTISSPGKAPQVDYIDADLFHSTGLCLPLAATEARSLPLVAVGTAVPGHQLRIVDGQGCPVAERVAGEIEVFGPGIIDGYWGDWPANGDLKRADGYLRTGDLGYISNGQLYITGRKKEIIIINGRNYIPNQIEAFVESILETDIASGVVAFGKRNDEQMTESLQLLLDLRLAAGQDKRTLEEKIRGAIADVFGLSGVGIYWVTAGEIPKTENGKVQRQRCRESFQHELKSVRPI